MKKFLCLAAFMAACQISFEADQKIGDETYNKLTDEEKENFELLPEDQWENEENNQEAKNPAPELQQEHA